MCDLHSCVVWISHNFAAEDFARLRCDVMLFCENVPTFRKNLTPSDLRIKQSNSLSLKFKETLTQRHSVTS